MKVLAGAAVVLTMAGRMYFGVMTSDDAFISYRYARNLIQSHGLVYNVGERVLGTSTPLYALVMAGVTAAGLPVEASSVAIGIACDAAAVWVLYALLARAGFARSAAAGAALAGTVPLGIIPTSAGMETALYSLLVLLVFHQAETARLTGRTFLLECLAVALAVCRPDGAIAVAVALGALLLTRPAAGLRALAAVAAAGVVAATAALAYYGTLVPQSVVAKSTIADPAWTGVRLLGDLLFSRLHAVTTVLAAIGATALWRSAVVWRGLLVWWAVYVAVFALTGALAHANWYFVPPQAVYWGCVAVGLETVARRALSERAARAVVVAGSLALIAVAVSRWPAHRARFAQVHALREEPYLDVAREIASSDRPCNVAATEIGAIGYAFPGRIIDLGGLTTPAALRLPAVRLLDDLDAQWLVTQNIYMPQGLAAASSFTNAFALVRSMPLEPGRLLLVYERRRGACARS
jgi:arabinofuranosyltransferase